SRVPLRKGGQGYRVPRLGVPELLDDGLGARRDLHPRLPIDKTVMKPTAALSTRGWDRTSDLLTDRVPCHNPGQTQFMEDNSSPVIGGNHNCTFRKNL